MLRVARDSIEYGLRQRQPLPVNAQEFSPELQAWRGVFVTLTLDDELRGCVGTLEATQPLIANVAKYGYAAAFSDSRFPPLRQTELPGLKIHISVLTEPEPIKFSSEADLLRQIQPGVDGLLLEEGACRGTLLPSVWEDIPDPTEFLRRLKIKAGLSPYYWSASVAVKRYRTVMIE